MADRRFDGARYSNAIWRSEDGLAWRHVADAPWSPRTGGRAFEFRGRLWPIGGGTIDGPISNEIWSSPDGLAWADHEGSIVSVANSSGTSLGVNAYDEWGLPLSTNLRRFQYTGQAWLPEIGMHYYKARIYSPHWAGSCRPIRSGMTIRSTSMRMWGMTRSMGGTRRG